MNIIANPSQCLNKTNIGLKFGNNNYDYLEKLKA